MKTLYAFITAILIMANGFAQSPLKMSYQAVIRNSTNNLVTNKSIGMQISILQGSASGTLVYQEKYNPNPVSNANGLVSVEIGGGTPVSGAFANINWANGPYFIKTETDPVGGSNYTISGVSQLLSVPFALYAKNVENVNDADADPTNEIQNMSISGTILSLSKGGGTVTLPSAGGGDNWGTQAAITDATLTGSGTTASPLKVAQQAATTGQVLKWNGTTWVPANDATGASGLTLPYSQTVANNDFAFSVTNSLNSAIKGSSSSNTSAGVYGYNSATFGFTNGVIGESNSVSGTGIYGKASAVDGFNIGVSGESASKAGTGVYGYNSAKTGFTFGVKGYTSSSDGWGVVGEAPRFGTKGIGGEVGLYGEASFSYGIGVQGVGVRYGIFGQGFYGVYGGSNDFDGFGVYGASQSCGVKGEASSVNGLGVLGFASSATGKTYGIKGISSSPEGIGVNGVAPLYGVFGEGAYGVYGSSTAAGGYGVYGSSTSCGVRGFSSSETGIGVLGNNPSGSGQTFGVKGLAGSVNGTGVYGDGGKYGVYGETNTSNAIGVYGVNSSTTGYTYGVFGTSASTDGTGVYGNGGAFGVYGNSPVYGIYGTSASTSGHGVYAIETSTSGTTFGVKGISNSSSGTGVYGSSKKYGIYGDCLISGGYAGYFNGRLAVTGYVGIGVSDPSYMLDVAGSINLNSGKTGSALYCNGNEALGFDGNVFSWGYQSQYNYFARPVAIGTSDYPGSNLLVVNGSAAKPGGGSWTTWSDLRLKDIHGNYEKGLNEIISLQPVKFTYKVGNACHLPSDQNYVGFVAQEVRKIFPEAVTEGKDGYLNLDVNAINVALVNAVKELKNENDRLKKEIEQFNSRLAKIENLIKK
jgi:hypothetical protein